MAYNSRVRRLTPCLLALLLPASAAAAPTVLYGPSFDPVTAAARAAEYLESGEFRVVGPVSDLVSGADSQLVMQGLAAQRCLAATGDLRPVLGVARIQVLEMEFESAMTALDAAAQALPCGAAQATREELFDLHFLRGLAAFNDGREADARASFSEAAAVSSAQPWPNSYPPTAKGLYLESLQAALSSRATVLDTDLADLVVNGERADATRGVPLLPGRHVVRWGDDVALVTATVEGGSGRLTTGGTLRVWLETADEAAGPWLAGFAQAEGWERVILLQGDRVLELRGQQLVVQEATKAVAGLDPEAAAGLSMVGIGLGTFGVGMSAMAGSTEEARALEARVEDGQEIGEDVVGLYNEYVTINRVGLGLGVGGLGLAAGGAVLAIVAKLQPKTTTLSAAAPRVLPGLSATADRVVLGLSGTF